MLDDDLVAAVPDPLVPLQKVFHPLYSFLLRLVPRFGIRVSSLLGGETKVPENVE